MSGTPEEAMVDQNLVIDGKADRKSMRDIHADLGMDDLGGGDIGGTGHAHVLRRDAWMEGGWRVGAG